MTPVAVGVAKACKLKITTKLLFVLLVMALWGRV